MKKVYTLVVDTFGLDGGSMFGSVPKPLWEKKIPADSHNRISLASRVLVVEFEDRKILVDGGIGPLWDSKGIDRFDIALNYTSSLSEIIPDVTDVILTHLHFDHAGGFSFLSSGVTEATFPQARHYVPRVNLANSITPNEKERGSYSPNHLTFLDSVNVAEYDDGDEIFSGVIARQVNGHTEGMCVIEIYDQNKGICSFVSDLVPTEHHVRLPYIMGFDICSGTTLKEKNSLLSRYVDMSMPIIFEHSRTMCGAYLKRGAKDFEIDRVFDIDTSC